jgi:hypothetical protein
MINTVDKEANNVVMGLLTMVPMRFLLLVNSTKGITAKGRPNESTTWLITRVRVGSAPRRITINEGRIVTTLRIQGGM